MKPTAGDAGSAASRAEYERRIHRVVAHIDAHLDAALDLETLAAVAHFSPFHFHRLFVAWTGETLADYVRRRRVEQAAVRLLAQPGLSVLQVALAVGFGSGEAFARAFRQRFGQPPSRWREASRDAAVPAMPDRKNGQVLRKAGQVPVDGLDDHGLPTTRFDEAPLMNVTLIELPPTPVAYFRYVGPYGPPVGRFWQEQMAPWMGTNQLFGKPRYGVSLDDPDITDHARCRYDACVELALDAVVSGSPLRAVLPGGRYASTPFKGTVDTINEAWRALLRGWLPGSGLQLDSRPFLEHYPVDASYDAASGTFECRLCIPVTPL
ncbi:MAG: AraC family transcriptional regulator [Proteobacteria bacterium]|nr:AraC family transcriptional regulator [Pseudomonadota bacterium]